MIIIKGRQSVKESLESDQKPKAIMIPSDAVIDKSLRAILDSAARCKVPVERLEKRRFLQLAEDKHQQVIARMAQVKTLDFKDFKDQASDLIVALDHIEDPHNMGAIFRSCEALGVKDILYPKQRASSIGTGVVRASAGALWHLNLCPVSNIAQRLRQLKQDGYWVYAASEHGDQPLQGLQVLKPAVLVLGNEHRGVSHIVQKLVDTAIQIPMAGKVSSLNVSVAAGILLFNMQNPS
eukprot:COSAG01_NODE_6_length_54687_cov_500.907599_27_plen_237_part_00